MVTHEFQDKIMGIFMGRIPQGKAFTERHVKQLKVPGYHCDPSTTGLYLKIRPVPKEANRDPAKRWLWRGRVKGHHNGAGNWKVAEVSLGSYPLVSLKQAREKALRHRSVAYVGTNPLDTKEAIPSFREVTEEVWRLSCQGIKNEKEKLAWIRSLKNNYSKGKLTQRGLLEAVGEKRIDHVAKNDLKNFLAPIWPKIASSKKKLERIRRIYKFAIFQGYVSTDPTVGIEDALPRRRNLPTEHARALKADKLPAFLKELHKTDRANPVVKLAMEFLILTHARTGEVLQAQWNQIDLKEKVWLVPKGIMKESRAHAIPLTTRALAILKEAKQWASENADAIENAQVIFPGTSHWYKDVPGTLSNGTLLKLRTNMGYKDDFVIHGFRSTFGTWAMESSRYGEAPADKALSHIGSDNKIKRSYFRSDLFAIRRKQQEEWEAFLYKRTKKKA